jgi:cytochrome b
MTPVPVDPPPESPVAAARAPARARLRIWDLPTRVFHWSLAACVLGSVVSAKVGGNAMVWHFRFGYAVLALLLFRVVWGFAGGHWSRFGSFWFGPGALLRYLRGTPRAGEHLEVGHSPMGALSVFALLALLFVQVATGLVADDEIANLGPLAARVSPETSLAATGWHEGYGQWLILAMVGLHIAAIAFYVGLRGKDLLGPMLGGDRELPVAEVAATPASTDGARSRAVALVVGLVCAGAVAALIAWGAP